MMHLIFHYSTKISVAAISTNILQMNDYIKYKCLNFLDQQSFVQVFREGLISKNHLAYNLTKHHHVLKMHLSIQNTSRASVIV